MTAGGRVVKSAPVVWAGLVDRGIWRTKDYSAGDGVTFKGSYWIAERDTDGRPGEPDSGWRLAVKRGRDGRPDRMRGPHLEGGTA
jgi:integrin beta 3